MCPARGSEAERGEALFGTVDSFLVWWLTGGPDGGVHITDVTNASRTLLMDLATLDWDDELLAIDRGAARDAAGDSPEQRGLCHGARRPGRACRSPASSAISRRRRWGRAVTQPGEAKNTYGTGCFMLLNTGETIVPVAPAGC